MSLLVTGFGPFGDVVENPSSRLAQECGKPHEVLEVSFRAAEDFLSKLRRDPPRALLCIGVAAKAEKVRFETVAHNRIGPTPDVRKEVWGPGPIDPAGPPLLAGRMWKPHWLLETDLSEPSMDPGGYLCNYLYYRALSELPQSAIGFLHVPSFAKIDAERQSQLVAAVIEGWESG